MRGGPAVTGSGAWLAAATTLILLAPPVAPLPRTTAEAARIAEVVRPATGFVQAEPFEDLSGGAATVRLTGPNAFSAASATMAFERELAFKVGNGLFRKLWVSAPSSTRGSDGLGPLYNARACQGCHLKDGRGHPPEAGEDAVSYLLRLSRDGAADPVYGHQIQGAGSVGQVVEARVSIAYAPWPVTFDDGTAVMLRAPRPGVDAPGFGPLDPAVVLSPRVAPPMIGLGLLEAIPEAEILAHADPDDADGDGISGRAARVAPREAGGPTLGRFGWKAGSPTVRQQAAEAFSGDLGLSTTLLPAGWGDCTPSQAACRTAPDGGRPEIGDEALDLVTFYSRNLAVPGRRGAGTATILRGKAAFYGAGCPACHVPKFVTARLPDQPEQSFQLVWPYGDLLLHDMGDGLADRRADGAVADDPAAREWRTPPLWGIGLTEAVTGRARYLHDGRARTLTEAILWHGGEAEMARSRVLGMSGPMRDDLLAFLGSL